MAEKGRPGVMLYFDVRTCLKRLSLEEKGSLFEGMLDYAQYGVVPEFEGMLGVAWDFMQPRIDHDAERYEEITESRRKAALKRWEKQGEQPQSDANAFFAMQTMPTTTSTTNTTTKTTPSATATPTPTAHPAPSGCRKDPNREELAEEMTFEDMRRRKMQMLDQMIAAR